MSRTPALFLSLATALGLAGCNDFGVAEKVAEDDFTQDGGNLQVDVLWVVDDSQTMTEEQDMLATNVTTFVDALEAFGADWQLAVVTTDVARDDAGVLIGGIFSPSSTMDEVSAAFAVGANGDRTEEGLASMELALSDPLASTDNAGFLREASDLGVIFVSDEDDSSPGDTTTYSDFLTGVKGPGHVRAAAIVGQLPDGCDSPTAAADPGTRYLDVVTATGGVEDSICLVDFTSTMKEIALSTLGLEDTFVLTDVPALDSVEVQVDGVDIYHRDTDGWSYDAGHNAIHLDGHAIPPPGGTVVVRYHLWSGGADTGDTGG